MTNRNNQLKWGVVLSYVNIGAQIVVSLLYTPYLIRMLGQSEYGLFSIAFSAIGLFSILDLGFGNANIRYTAKYRAAGDTQKENELHGMFLMLYSVIGVISLILGAVFYINIERLFGAQMTAPEIQKLKTMILMVVVSISISFPLSVFGFIIQAYERFVFSKLLALLRILLVPILAILALVMGYRSVAIILAISVVSVLLLMIHAVYCLKVLKIKISFHGFNKDLFKEIIGYSFFIFVGIIATRINRGAHQFILGMTSGAVAVSLFSLAFNLIANFMHVSGAIASVFLPTITRIPVNESGLKQSNSYFVSIGRLQFYMLSLFYLGFIFFGKQFITLWAGPGYATSYTIAIILLTPLCFVLTQSTGLTVLQSQNLHKYSSIVLLTTSVFGVILSFILSSFWGAIGTTVALSITWILGQGVFLNIFYARQVKLDVIEFWKQILRIIPSFIPAMLVGFLYVHFLKADSWLSLFIGAMLFSIVYGVSVVKFSFNRFEKESVLYPVLTRIPLLKRRIKILRNNNER